MDMFIISKKFIKINSVLILLKHDDKSHYQSSKHSHQTTTSYLTETVEKFSKYGIISSALLLLPHFSQCWETRLDIQRIRRKDSDGFVCLKLANNQLKDLSTALGHTQTHTMHVVGNYKGPHTNMFSSIQVAKGFTLYHASALACHIGNFLADFSKLHQEFDIESLISDFVSCYLDGQ